MTAKEKLRLPDFDNEHVEIISFDFGSQSKRSWQYPTRAEFLTGNTGVAATAVVYLNHPEDHTAFSKAGFDLKGFEGKHNPPITVLIQKDRIASVKGVGGQWVDVVRTRDDTPLQIVTNALPVRSEETDEPRAPLAYVEPDEYTPRRRGDDGGSGFTNGMASLFRKKAQIMLNLKAIPKRGWNKEQGYDYVTDADLYDAVRTEMAKANLALQVRMKDIRKEKETKTYSNGNSKETVTTLVDLDFILCCGDTGATETSPWTGSTLNPGDKAISAAVTVAEKYFLKATFIISTGDVADDPDSGLGDDAPGEPRRSSGVSKRTNPPRQPKQEAKPEAAKSANTGVAGSGNAGTPPAVDGADMPDDLFQALMKDKDIVAASSSAPERAATIRKMWGEGGITAEMDEYDRVLAVIDRLNTHKKGGAK